MTLFQVAFVFLRDVWAHSLLQEVYRDVPVEKLVEKVRRREAVQR